MRSKLLLEIKVTIGALIIAVFYFASSFAVQESSMKLSSNNLPPGLYPRLVGVLLIITISWVLFTTICKYKKALKENNQEDEAAAKLKFIPRNVFVGVCAYILYLVSLYFIGFVPGNILFAAGILTYLNPAKWLTNIIYAVIFTMICYGVFNYVLTIYLPSGIIFE